jgi:hypothetical protein
MDGEVASGVKRDNQSTLAGRLDKEAAKAEFGDLTDQFLLGYQKNWPLKV